ncbi:hypothetical protein CY34DRAFT_803422 [Suillus luteus UH-Slu-Lm8-n1]|uniref:Uncharacterized protein n=1 Tax=Suillus luteus UH-Slu-Lm8-n1 TaxID=930992 RepID=A0A0D0APT8_9AGAM|nr:hypothetical protein CY34DRAFT_803422 [Suillus luteus UH-Slu-Lm8-n1]
MSCTTYTPHETLVSGETRSKATAYNSELRVSSLSNFRYRIFAQPMARSVSRRHCNALCMHLFEGAKHGRGGISQSSHLCPRDLEAWLFIASCSGTF